MSKAILTKSQSALSRRLRKEFAGAGFDLRKWDTGRAFLVIQFASAKNASQNYPWFKNAGLKCESGHFANQIRVELL